MYLWVLRGESRSGWFCRGIGAASRFLFAFCPAGLTGSAVEGRKLADIICAFFLPHSVNLKSGEMIQDPCNAREQNSRKKSVTLIHSNILYVRVQCLMVLKLARIWPNRKTPEDPRISAV